MYKSAAPSFDSILVRLKEKRALRDAVTFRSFDSILVRLKARTNRLTSGKSYLSFDSILVRLKAQEAADADRDADRVSIPYWFD